MAKHSMYDETPKMEHDEDGNVKVKKSAKPAPEDDAGDTGEPDGAGLDELIKEHKEMKAMHDKHQADMMARIKKHATKPGATSGSNDVGAPIKDIEKGAK